MAATEATDTLMSLAQIASAFAGFSALVSALKERANRAESLHDILRLRIVTSTSVVVVAASLIPVALANFGLPDRVVWGLSAVMLLALNYGVLFSFVRSYRPVQDRFPPDRLAVGLVGALELLDQAALVLILLNLLPGLDYPLYLAALVCNVCQAAFILLRFVGSEFSVK
jgi:hypothetical protein